MLWLVPWLTKQQRLLLLDTVQFLSCHCCSAAQSYPTLCNTMDCSTPVFPVLHHLLEFAQTHVHWVSDTTAIVSLFYWITIYIFFFFASLSLPLHHKLLEDREFAFVFPWPKWMFAHHWLTKISIAPEIRKGQAAFNGKRSVLCICSLTLLHCFLPEGALKIMPVFFITEITKASVQAHWLWCSRAQISYYNASIYKLQNLK